MFSHVMLGADDLEVARTFYDATFAALGIEAGNIDPKGRLVYMHAGGRFLITRPIDGRVASPANGGTIGFLAPSPRQSAGVAAGGSAIEGGPGIRDTAGGKRYLAYLRDPTGNKLCAAYRFPA